VSSTRSPVAVLVTTTHRPARCTPSLSARLAMERRGSMLATPSSSRIPLGKRTAATAGLEAAPPGGELNILAPAAPSYVSPTSPADLT
jgi:hypothetical protein